jgi:hypothetical protein
MALNAFLSIKQHGVTAILVENNIHYHETGLTAGDAYS